MPSVIGSFSASGQSAPIRLVRPAIGEPARLNVTLYGTFSATIGLERSFDEGVNWHPITGTGDFGFVWAGPASITAVEPEKDVLYRLNCSSYASGTANYRLSF